MKKIIDIINIKKFDKNISKLVKSGLIFCLIFCLFSVFILLTYEMFYSMPILFYIGYSLFKSSLMFAVTFIICGIGFDKIKKEIKN